VLEGGRKGARVQMKKKRQKRDYGQSTLTHIIHR